MRAWLAALLLAFSFGAPALAQHVLSPTQFRDAAIAMIQAADPAARIEVRDDLGITIRREPDAPMPEVFANLDNVYAEYRASPEALDAILGRWVRFVTQPHENVQMADRVVAVVRARAMAEAMSAESAGERTRSGRAPSALIWRPLAGDLVEVLVFDGDETIQYAMEEALAEIGLTVEQAWAAAPRNLPARLGELEMSGVVNADHLAYVSGGNGLAPSTLLDGGVCSNGSEGYAFLVVDRNGYLAVSRDDVVGMAQLGAVLRHLRGSGQSMSLTPLGCHQGRVVEITLTD